MIIPSAIVREVASAPASTARLAANRLLDAGPKPLVIIVANELALVCFVDALTEAIDSARAKGDDKRADAWRSLALRLLACYDGVQGEPT